VWKRGTQIPSHHIISFPIFQAGASRFFMEAPTSFRAISSWVLLSISRRVPLPLFNSFSPRMRAQRAFNLSARRIWLFRLFPS